MSELHPQVQELLRMTAAAGRPPLYETTLEDARERPAMIGRLTGPGPEMAAEEDLAIGPNQVPARLYTPQGGPGAALVVYFHGGGWVVGQVTDFDAVCRRLAAAAGCQVLNVGYRLAPEHPFPAGLEDAHSAVEWAAAELADGRPLVLVGDSAGGNLVAVISRRLRDAEHGAEVALQVLVYPVTDHDFARPSYAEHGDSGYPLGAREMEWFWDHYVPAVADRDDPDAAPLRAAELAGLPPALVIVAEHDPLRDEALLYVERLREAGVEVSLRHYGDVTHGFFTMAGFLDRGEEAIGEIGQAIKASHGVE